MWCHDDEALNWLNDTVPKLTSPKTGTELTVIRQTDIIVRVRSGLYIPDYDEDIGLLHEILSLQNPWYDMAQWSLYSHQVSNSANNKPPGVFLVLGIPTTQIPTILELDRAVAYSTGTIYIRFFTSDGLSDVPPGYHPAPKEPGVDARMDVDAPAGQHKKTPEPEPSVSTVLKDIEAMLAEQTEDSKAKTNTAPADQLQAWRAPQP